MSKFSICTNIDCDKRNVCFTYRKKPDDLVQPYKHYFPDKNGECENFIDINHSTVRENLLTQRNYTPYCGSHNCMPRRYVVDDRWPRTFFNGAQFECPKCSWSSSFPENFITAYKAVWNL